MPFAVWIVFYAIDTFAGQRRNGAAYSDLSCFLDPLLTDGFVTLSFSANDEEG